MRKAIQKSNNTIEQYHSYLTLTLVFMTLVVVSSKPVNCTCVTCHNKLFNVDNNNIKSNNQNDYTAHQQTNDSDISRQTTLLKNNEDTKHQIISDYSKQFNQSINKLTDLSQEELNNVRTEFFKYKILDKLGLIDEPKVTGARAPEFGRDFVANFHINHDTDNMATSDNNNERNEASHQADKLILTAHLNSFNELEFDLHQSNLIRMLNNRLSSVKLSIRLKNQDSSGIDRSRESESITTRIHSASKTSSPSIRLILKQEDNVRDRESSPTKDISIDNNNKNNKVVLSSFNQMNPGNSNITSKPIDVMLRVHSETTIKLSDNNQISQSLFEIELLPIIAEMFKNDNNQQQFSIKDRIYEDLILDKVNYRYKVILLPTANIEIKSAYLSLINKGSETMFTRSKRSVDCATIKNNKSSCCRESFYVNFTDIGWDKWILHPPGYYANYCKGRCDLSHARFYHSSILSRFSNLISLCCSPKQMSHLTLIYLDQDHQLHQKVMPDMTVESCDCS